MSYKIYVTPTDTPQAFHGACQDYMSTLDIQVEWLQGISCEYESPSDLTLHPAVLSVDMVESEIEFDTNENMQQFCAVLEQYNVEFCIIN